MVETLVAVLLLVVAIAGPLTVASRAFNAALIAKDQIVAYYLAQDAMEYVRFVRDTNCLAAGTAQPCNTPSSPWLTSPTSLSACVGSSCTVNSITPAVAGCTHTVSSTCDVLYYNTTLKQFTHTGPASATNIQTRFKRVVAITSPVAGNTNEALVTVTVYWRNGTSAERNVTLSENIYNWQ